jgi:hypothetical protein
MNFFSILLIILITFKTNALEVCNINFANYNLDAPVDCIKCQKGLNSPANPVERNFNPVMNFFTGEKEQREEVNKFKILEHFLAGKQNQERCSNFKELRTNFNSNFQKYLSDCEKKPDLINRNKYICDWVLNTYSKKITDAFYDYWRTVGPGNKITFIKDRKMEDLEFPIRAHFSWCKKIENNYGKSFFLDCGEVKNWVQELDTAKKIDEGLKRSRDMAELNNAPTTSREEMLRNACKYFDNNMATTFTKELYLKCIAE